VPKGSMFDGVRAMFFLQKYKDQLFNSLRLLLISLSLLCYWLLML
jgi:hypothetical protein